MIVLKFDVVIKNSRDLGYCFGPFLDILCSTTFMPQFQIEGLTRSGFMTGEFNFKKSQPADSWSGIFKGRGGFFKLGYKSLAVLKFKVKCKHQNKLLSIIIS